jgi:hypothetical protein
MDAGIVAILSLFVFLPGLLVGGGLAGKWFRWKEAELQVRREELEVQKKKLDFLAIESKRELLERLDQDDRVTPPIVTPPAPGRS